ncbi:hypothetical protein B0H11DRAFT_2242711 [Mycena galericulata]|nr:hypothetical protein B0H11DRAFT_2242711 [Mycena galericulata]
MPKDQQRTGKSEAEKKKVKAADKRDRRRAKASGETITAKKRGNPGNFRGRRLQFLQKAAPDYLKASGKGRGGVPAFLATFLHGWWATFPWYSGLDPADVLGSARRGQLLDPGESADTAAGDDNGAQDELDEGEEGLDVSLIEGTDDALRDEHASQDAQRDEDAQDAQQDKAAGTGKTDGDGTPALTGGIDPELRGAVEEIITMQIKSWFSYRKTVANRSNKNPFAAWMSGFRQPPPAPRKQQLAKYYMHLDAYAKKVDELFQSKWPSAGLEPRFELDFRCKCAKELLALEPNDVQKKLATDVDAAHDKAVEKHMRALEALADPEAPLDEEAQLEYRKSLAEVAQPFPDSLAKLTGYHLTLLAGAAPPEGSVKYLLTTVHSGRTYVPGMEGLKFDEWQPEVFKKNVMGQFMRFLLETKPHSATVYTLDEGDVAVHKEGAAAKTPEAGVEGRAAKTPEAGGEGGAEAEMHVVEIENEAETGEEAPRGRTKTKGKAKGKAKRKGGRSATPEETPSPSGSEAGAWSRSRSRDATTQRTPSPETTSWPETPKLPPTHIPSPALLAELAAASMPARRNRLGRLAYVSQYEFDRESNIARNKALVAALGLKDLRAEVLGPKPPPPQKKRKEPVTSAGPRRTSKRLQGKDIAPLMLPEGGMTEEELQEIEDDPDADEEDEGDDDEDAEGTNGNEEVAGGKKGAEDANGNEELVGSANAGGVEGMEGAGENEDVQLIWSG